MSESINFGDHRLLLRFWDKCIPEPNSGCWLWIGALTRGDYGTLTVGGGRGAPLARAHRYAYERLIAPVDQSLDLDHLCRVRCCVNPAHLEPVTRAVNMARSPIASHMRKFQTHCKRGHEFTPENTKIRDCYGKPMRQCIACSRIRARAQHQRTRAA